MHIVLMKFRINVPVMLFAQIINIKNSETVNRLSRFCRDYNLEKKRDNGIWQTSKRC